VGEELERQQPSFLDVIREVVANPDVPVDKLKAIMDMQFQLEDRRASQEFDQAMIEAQAEILELKWDKKGGSNNQYASYPKIDKMLRPIRKNHGFTQSYDTEPGPAAELVILCSDVIHKGGHRRRYRTPMPIDGQGPKGGGVMTKNQAVNAGTSYGMRNLAKMIWNIPMLVDKDDIDGNDIVDTISEEQAINLRSMCEQIDKEQERRLCEYYGQQCKREITKLEQLPKAKYQDALRGLTKKIRDGA
jgi:hypothetical protein